MNKYLATVFDFIVCIFHHFIAAFCIVQKIDNHRKRGDPL